jgi:hypothetical protein
LYHLYKCKYGKMFYFYLKIWKTVESSWKWEKMNEIVACKWEHKKREGKGKNVPFT